MYADTDDKERSVSELYIVAVAKSPVTGWGQVMPLSSSY